MKENIAIMFGGISPEHEVSVITGLQVVDAIDKERYEPVVIFVDKTGIFYYLKGITSRKEFLTAKRHKCFLGKDEKGGYLGYESLGIKKIYLAAAYLAFHGGGGEGGYIQGMLQSLGIPMTSPLTESAVITMSKILTKTILSKTEIPLVEDVHIFSDEVKGNISEVTNKITDKLGLPVILKPSHLGSSIGVSVAKTKDELETYLSAAALVDTEILVERFLSNFEEFNVSVIKVDNELITSEIERPVKKDELLSFADKYQRGGGKKTNSSGMAALLRELPAKIDQSLKSTIVNYAKIAYKNCRCTGLVRIDFMHEIATKKLYFTELNQIPGSMSFYLWEASGLSFTEQVTRSIEQAKIDLSEISSLTLNYNTDIIEKFVNSSS